MKDKLNVIIKMYSSLFFIYTVKLSKNDPFLYVGGSNELLIANTYILFQVHKMFTSYKNKPFNNLTLQSQCQTMSNKYWFVLNA